MKKHGVESQSGYLPHTESYHSAIGSIGSISTSSNGFSISAVGADPAGTYDSSGPAGTGTGTGAIADALRRVGIA